MIAIGLAGAAAVLCGYITVAIRADRPTWTLRTVRPGNPRARFDLEPWPVRQTPTDLAAAYEPWPPVIVIGRPPARELVAA